MSRLINLVLLCALGLPITVAAQSSSSTDVQIVECEGSGCTPGGPNSPVWSFSASPGVGQFSTGAQPLTIEHIDDSAIAVRRVDVTGPATGLTALYMGRIEGRRIAGSVLYYDRNNASSPRTGVWNGIITGTISSLTSAATGLAPRYPFTLHECEGNQCLQPGTRFSITWTFPSANGQGWLGDSPRPMLIEDLTPGFILARRTDAPPLSGLIAFYFGEINGKQITGSVVYFDPSRPNQPRSGTWFGVIQDTFTPMQTATGPAAPAAPPNTTTSPAANSYEAMKAAHHQQLFTDDGCPREAVPASGDDAFALFYKGKQVQADEADQMTDLNALRFYCAAFKAGYGPAAFEIGEIYYGGVMLPSIQADGRIFSDTVSPDMAKALDWYKRAASMGSTQGQIKASWFYRNGPVIHFHSGDYNSVNPQPVDILASVKFLRDAANAGDTEALRDIIDVNTQGADGAEPLARRADALTGWGGQLRMKMAEAQKACLGELPDIVKRELEARRWVNGLQAAESHDHSVICLVALDPAKTPNSIGGEIYGVLNGRPLASWIYTLYTTPDGDSFTIRNSVNAEYMRRLMQYAQTAATQVNQQH